MVSMPSTEHSQEINDDALLCLIASGNVHDQRRALEVLYWRWTSPMKHFFLARGCDAGVGEDLMQESVIRIWKGASSFQGSGKASAWIWSVIRNTLTDYQRKSLRRPPEQAFDPDNPEHEGKAEDPYDQERDDCIARGLERFAIHFPERAYALELWSAGIHHEEIAKQLGRSYGATRQFLLECRKKMRPFLKPCFDSRTGG